MKRSERTKFIVAGDDRTAMFAAAAHRLDWKVTAAAGDSAASIRHETRAKVQPLDRLLHSTDADIAVVGTAPERRWDDTRRLVGRGIGVVLVPPVGRERFETWNDDPGRVVLGDPVPMSPAIQRWMLTVQSIAPVERIWISATPAMTFSACSLAVLAARNVRSMSADDVEISIGGNDELPRIDVQVAGPDDAATAALFPTPTVELNGVDISPSAARHPADAFGAADLLTRFAADLAGGTAPALGLGFLTEALDRQSNL